LKVKDEEVNPGEAAKSAKLLLFVIPANPGSGPGQAQESSKSNSLLRSWTPVSTGVTTFCGTINLALAENAVTHEMAVKQSKLGKNKGGTAWK
jgi:hypothetical protein